MFNGQAAPHVAHTQERPKYVRYNSDPSNCHLVQKKRSSLGDTHGAVYIPGKDKNYARGNQRVKHTSSVPRSPLSSPLLEGFMHEIESAPLHQDGAGDGNDYRSITQFDDASYHPEPSLDGIVKEEVSEAAEGRIGSPQSTSSFSSQASGHAGALLRPHFASSGGLRVEPESYLLNDKGRSASVPYLGPLKRDSVSLPHDYWDNHDQSREYSISSVSSYLRANAFLGHRDTLARIKHTSSTPGSSSASLALYPASTIASIPSSLLTRHRDTFARINYKRRPALPVPKAVFERLIHYLTFDDYKALRLTCRTWLSSLPAPHIPASHRVPAELLQEVYGLLSPIDFDAVRHTCRPWFLASLDRRLLVTMSRRDNCYGSTQADLYIRLEHHGATRRSMNGCMWVDHDGSEIEDCHQPETDDLVSEEWVYSKRLAIESMLSPGWRGISLKYSSATSTDGYARMTSIGSIEFSLASRSQRRSIDAPSSIPVNAFTVSGCGKFVLVINGRVVFVCELLRRKPGMQPLTRIVCPRKVLGVSMDTSSKRYAVAILLEGRVGMCCNLTDGFGDAIPVASSQADSMQLGMSADVRGSNAASRTIRPTLSALPLRRAEVTSSTPTGQFFVSRASEAFISPASNTSAGSSPDDSWFDHAFSRYGSQEELPDGDQDAISKVGIPIESGPRTVYNNLCSFDDPPRSVAICPQRRCVAFGCRMGIELHWVDALTGSDLNRWFPLAAPSDYLYFLPARHGMDSAKKLRLISSAAGPYSQQQTATSLRGNSPSKPSWRASPNGSRRQSMTRLFFGNLPFPTATNMYGLPGKVEQNCNGSPNYAERDHGVLRTVDCDHYRAIPLSDGAHLIFTDPQTGHLCLGSDAPLGGPTKLLRKVVCLPPDDENARLKPEGNNTRKHISSRPWVTCYSSGRDLRWGVRITAAYSDSRIMLYSIPRDVFERMRNTRTGIDVWDERAGTIGQSDLLMDNLMQSDAAHGDGITGSNTTDDAGAHAEGSADFPDPSSLSIHGVEIGRAPSQAVEDIAVSSDFGGLRVWAFMENGLVRMWTLFRRLNGQEEKWIVGNDGIVRNKKEAKLCKESVSMTTKVGMSGRKGEGKRRTKSEEQGRDKPHIRFVGSGLDGAGDENADHRGTTGQEATSDMPRNKSSTPQLEGRLPFLLVSNSTISVRRFDLGYDLEDIHGQLQITILSDWRGVRLLDPYIILK